MAGTGNTKALQFSKYFPNHLEYASKVPRESVDPNQTKRPPKPRQEPEKKPKPYYLSVETQKSVNIYPETKTQPENVVPYQNIQIIVEPTVSVTVSTQTEETSKSDDKPRELKSRQNDEEVLQPDLPNNEQEYIIVEPDFNNSTAETNIVTCSTPTSQTETGYTTDESKIVRLPDIADDGKFEKIHPVKSADGTQQPHPTEEDDDSSASTDDPSESPDEFSTDENASMAWNDMMDKENNKPPRMVVSVIGFYDELVPNYNTKDQFALQQALRDVSKYVGRCGFLFNRHNTSFVENVVKSSYTIAGISSTLYGYNAPGKLKAENSATRSESVENVSESTEYNKDLLNLEIYINKQMTIDFLDEEDNKVRVPVVLVVVNGDLFTLEHVVRALYSDISVVVMKGTGGAADLIASCLQSTKYLKKMSVLFRRRFPEQLYKKLENVIHYIIERNYMITIFDLKKDSYDILWDKMTDGIMLAWSFEKQSGQSGEQPFGKEDIFLHVGETISKYVVDIERLTKYELFGGFNLQRNNKALQKDLFINALFNNRTDIIRQVLTNKIQNVTCSLSDDQLRLLYNQSINQNKDKYKAHVTLIWQKTAPEAYDFLKNRQGKTIHSTKEATKLLTDKLLKGLCCSKIGMVTCCNTCHRPTKGADYKKSNEKEDSDEVFQHAVLSNNVENAGQLWINSTNPMLTALISSCYLVSMADRAEELFEDTLRQELNDHSKRFSKRAEVLLEKMFKEDDRLASEALNLVTIVWNHEESPLHFGQQFNLEEFISHTAAQKDASKRLFAFNPGNIDDGPRQTQSSVTSTQDSQKPSNDDPHPSCLSFIKHYWKRPLKIVTAPICKFIFHKLLLVTSLILFSLFLTRDLSYNTISVFEVFVCVFVFGDFVEELFNMFRLDDECRWSPQRIFLHLFNIWNFLAIASIAFYLVGFCMHLFGGEDIMVDIRRIYSIALFLMYLRLLNALLLTKRFGIIIIMVKEMLVDLLEYLVILVILLFAAGIVYHANIYPNHTVNSFPSTIGQWRIWSILKIPYWQVYGELYLDTLEGSSESECTNNITVWSNDPSVERCPTGDWITPVIAAFYMMLTNWLLLNIVIAMFSARFDKIRERSEQKWRFYRHSVVITYENWIPSPLNLIFRPFLVVYGISKCPCPCCSCCKMIRKGKGSNMLQKQRDFAKQIIDDENEKSRHS